MKFVDLPSQYRSIKRPLDRAISATISSGQFILGENVGKLEAKIAQLAGAKYAIGLNSGTDALFLSLQAIGVGKGDEVITTPFSFVASAEVIAHSKAKLVFVDIDSRTYNIDPTKIEKAITKRTATILPVHLYGQMADMSAIMRLALKYRLYVIEDAAQAIGATQKIESRKQKVESRMAGSVGHAGCFSFFPTKNLGAYGDAGMVVTNDKKLAEKIRMLRNHGARAKYLHEFLGYSSRLDELQAAILLAKLPYLVKWNRERVRIAQTYTKALSSLPKLQTPLIAAGNLHVFHQYTIRTPYRDRLRIYLEKRSIPTAVHYPTPLHLQPAFRYLGYRRGAFPEAERAAKEVLSLPIYPELKPKDQQKIIREIKRFFASL